MREKEAGAKAPVIGAGACNCAHDSRLAGASHAIKPEYAWLTTVTVAATTAAAITASAASAASAVSAGPHYYFTKDVQAGARQI